jgi:hypothetical protein
MGTGAPERLSLTALEFSRERLNALINLFERHITGLDHGRKEV